MDSGAATARSTVIPTMGERTDRRLWREKGGERVAAVGENKPALSGAVLAGHRNRGSNATHCDSNMQPAYAGCNIAMVGKISRLK